MVEWTVLPSGNFNKKEGREQTPENNAAKEKGEEGHCL